MDLGCKDAAKGFVDCLTFLKQYADGKLMDLGSRVVVIGGGNAAIDSARVARRCGVKEISVIYRRGYKEMPADKAELAHAEAEGIMVRYFTLPVRIILNDDVVEGIECLKTKLCELDESGRGTPIPIEGSEFVIHASGIISAVGQKPDMMWNQSGEPFKLSAKNTFVTNGELATNIRGVFAAGDCVTGPSTIVEAMASGRRAAWAIKNYLKDNCTSWKYENVH
jgi:NADPH-dependent glutamate synthase beta subunit-like oxidoreductase